MTQLPFTKTALLAIEPPPAGKRLSTYDTDIPKFTMRVTPAEALPGELSRLNSPAIIGKSLNHRNHAATAIGARLTLDPLRRSANAATTAILEAAAIKEGADVVRLPTRIRCKHA